VNVAGTAKWNALTARGLELPLPTARPLELRPGDDVVDRVLASAIGAAEYA